MNYDKYEFVRVHKNLREFRFYSTGPKGDIEMMIQFQRINLLTYNLAFGRTRQDGSMDDTYNVSNQDRNKILATVAGAVYEFTSAYPDSVVYFSGNTPARCRLYRMAIGNNLSELAMFEILGVRVDSSEYIVEDFVKDSHYFEFFAKRKSI